MRLRPLILCLTVLLPTTLACGPKAEPEEETVEVWRVENPGLGLTIADMSTEFQMVANDDETLEFRRVSEDGTTARLWFEIGPTESGGINLVEIVNAQRDIYEARPAGDFKGNRELMMPDGRPAFYSRGQFDHDGVLHEEIRITALHPDRNATLQVFYRYPEAGQENSSERLNELLLMIGEVEAYGASAGQPDAAAADAAESDAS